MRLDKNSRTKKEDFFPVSDLDSNPGFGSGFESGSESETTFRQDRDPKPDPKILFWIRNTDSRD
jgi:hypothetical protein